MEFKNFESEIRDLDKKQGIVIISVAGIGNKDNGGDVIQPNAFKKTITENLKKIYHLLDHNWSTKHMVGVPVKMYETNDRLIAESQLNLKEDTGQDLFAKYLFLADLQRSFEHSIGFEIPKNKSEIQGDTRYISEVKLYEYSTVLLGMNSNTETIAIKAIEEHLKYPYSEKTLQKIESLLNQIIKNQTDLLPKIEAENTNQNITINSIISTDTDKKDGLSIDSDVKSNGNDKPLITSHTDFINELLKHL